ncbi:YtxH domain-containing protein [Sporosarcina sp. YIM B06819]|uniref:YtxH domain-containing protein n=1 Tax=Sporosarcina sp. YIM B06819 TaxID=3081769 RepID=UPI00298C67E7|nr:YtxH domain-containing protein [Sporosarcina sp. YIM B06819]
MSNSKFGKFIILGALVGAVASMFDRSTREQVTIKSKGLVSEIAFYSKNPDILKFKVQEKTDKYQSLYEQLAGDAAYIKAQVEELKTLTPQVKELVMDTKETFIESKDEYKAIVNEAQE